MEIGDLFSPQTWLSGISSKNRNLLEQNYQSTLNKFRNLSKHSSTNWHLYLKLEEDLSRQKACIPKRKFNKSILLKRSVLSESVHMKALCVIFHQNTKAWDLGNVMHELIISSHLKHAKAVASKLNLMPPILYESYRDYLKDARYLARQGEPDLARQLTVRGISVQKQLVTSAQKAFDLLELMVANQMTNEARRYVGKLLQYEEDSSFYVKAAEWASLLEWDKEAMDLYTQALKQKTKASQQSSS